MVAKQIPWIIGLGAVLAAYKLLGGSELLDEWNRKELQDSYDYIIGGYIVVVVCECVLECTSNHRIGAQ